MLMAGPGSKASSSLHDVIVQLYSFYYSASEVFFFIVITSVMHTTLGKSEVRSTRRKCM